MIRITQLAKRILKRFGNILCFELAGGREAVNQFFQKASGTPLSPSLGTMTTLSYPYATSHRYVDPSEKVAAWHYRRFDSGFGWN